MKKILLIALLLAGIAGACSHKGSAQWIAVATEAEGGFAAADPKFQVLVVRKADGSAVVLTRTREGVVKRGTMKSFDAFAARLNPVFALPRETKNVGMCDPYGMQISFHIHLTGKCWEQHPAAGCVRDEPTIKPSAAERATYGKMTSLVTGLTSVATSASSEDAWEDARKTLDS